MPRAGWVKPESDRRLSDLVSVGVLTRVFPPELVDEVIAGAGRTEQRHRSLPARVMAYFAIGMALHSEGSYEDVLSLLTDGLVVGVGRGGAVAVAVEVGDLPGPCPAGVRAGGGRCSRGWRAPLAASGDAGGVVGRAASGGDRRDLSGCGRHAR